MRRRIGLIGRIDLDETLFDGQTVKTRTIYRLLVQRYGEAGVVLADTRDYRTHPVRVAVQLARCLVGADRIVVCLSTNGRSYLFPVLHFASRVFGRKIFHSLIGGWLASDIRRSGSLIPHLNSFAVNWVESRMLRDELTSLGVDNARFMPNFKELTPVDEGSLRWRQSATIRLCIFSRIQERKGVTDAVLAVAELNLSDDIHVDLDLYGPVDDDYRTSLDALLKQHADVRYCGIVPPEKSVQVIAEYDGLLFPTRYYEEGIPGTIIDALASGVPVIAARWRYYSEVLEDWRTGASYDMHRPDQLAEAIRSVYFEGREVLEFKAECLRRAARYRPEAVFEQMVKALEGEATSERA